MDHTDTGTLLSLNDLRRKKEELDRTSNELVDLEKRYQAERMLLEDKQAKIQRWMAAVAVLLDDEKNEEIKELLPQQTEEAPKEPSSSAKVTMNERILAFDSLDTGMLPSEVIAKLYEFAEYNGRRGTFKSQVYTNLKRLVDRGKLEKKGGKYFLPSKQNEPSKLIGDDGSKSGSVNGSDPSLDLNPARPVH